MHSAAVGVIFAGSNVWKVLEVTKQEELEESESESELGFAGTGFLGTWVTICVDELGSGTREDEPAVVLEGREELDKELRFEELNGGGEVRESAGVVEMSFD
jgi:hypothetical protein